jgi:hypothetical protein
VRFGLACVGRGGVVRAVCRWRLYSRLLKIVRQYNASGDDIDAQLDEIIAKARELVRSAAQILGQPSPDTFLGRKTREGLWPRDPGKISA